MGMAAAAWNEARAVKLAAMMEAAIQRRFPKGLKVHVRSVDRFGCLSSLTRVLKDANLCVTRAKVCCCTQHCDTYKPLLTLQELLCSNMMPPSIPSSTHGGLMAPPSAVVLQSCDVHHQGLCMMW